MSSEVLFRQAGSRTSGCRPRRQSTWTQAGRWAVLFAFSSFSFCVFLRKAVAHVAPRKTNTTDVGHNAQSQSPLPSTFNEGIWITLTFLREFLKMCVMDSSNLTSPSSTWLLAIPACCNGPRWFVWAGSGWQGLYLYVCTHATYTPFWLSPKKRAMNSLAEQSLRMTSMPVYN